MSLSGVGRSRPGRAEVDGVETDTGRARGGPSGTKNGPLWTKNATDLSTSLAILLVNPTFYYGFAACPPDGGKKSGQFLGYVGRSNLGVNIESKNMILYYKSTVHRKERPRGRKGGGGAGQEDRTGGGEGANTAPRAP